MKTLIILALAAVVCGCTTNTQQVTQAPKPAPKATPAKASSSMTATQKAIQKAYVDCNGKTSIRMAFQPEPAQTIAMAAAAECGAEEGDLRRMIIAALGYEEGTAFMVDQTQRNLQFNMAMVIRTREAAQKRATETQNEQTPQKRSLDL